jgi:ubiquinol-cytochrome c reductase cytochrome b subunit
LLDYEEHKPLPVRPNEKGKITVGRRARSAFSNWFFEDRVSPVGERELEAQKH